MSAEATSDGISTDKNKTSVRTDYCWIKKVFKKNL